MYQRIRIDVMQGAVSLPRVPRTVRLFQTHLISQLTMASFYPLHVTHIRPDTRDAVVVTLRPADEHKELFRFKAGQYLTFRRKLDDEELRRSYSICSAEQDH